MTAVSCSCAFVQVRLGYWVHRLSSSPSPARPGQRLQHLLFDMQGSWVLPEFPARMVGWPAWSHFWFLSLIVGCARAVPNRSEYRVQRVKALKPGLMQFLRPHLSTFRSSLTYTKTLPTRCTYMLATSSPTRMRRPRVNSTYLPTCFS